MSATNRGRKRLKDDNYVTPAETINEFLSAFLANNPDLKAMNLPAVLDPCCGGDKKCPPPYVDAIHRHWPTAVVTTVDIRESSAAWIRTDFLTFKGGTTFDLIVSNPPYYLAQEFVDHALSLLSPGGMVAFLLRLNFLGSQKRREWWRSHVPVQIYVHSKRPSFKYGGTDACEYCHVVWQRDHDIPATQIYWL